MTLSPMLLATMTSRVLTVGTQLVVGSLLTPAQFGEFAVAASLVTFLSIFQSGDLSRLALQNHADRQRSAAQMRSTLLLGCGLSALAVFVVASLNQDRINLWFAGCLILLPFIRVISNTRVTLLSGDGAVRQVAVASFSESIARSVCSIALALAGCGAWSLIAGEVCAVFALAVSLNRACAGPPDAPPMLRLRAFRSLGAVTLSGVFNMVERELPVLAVGLALSSASAGHFAFAQRIASQLIILVTPMIVVEAIPRLIAVAKDAAGFESVRRRERKRLLKISAALAASFGIGAPVVIYLLWGDRWLGAAQILPVLVAAVVLRLGYLFNRGVLEASGRIRFMLFLSLLDAALIVGALGLSLLLGGNMLVAVALALEALAAYLVSRIVIARRAGAIASST